MKKSLFVVFALVTVFCCAIPAFAEDLPSVPSTLEEYWFTMRDLSDNTIYLFSSSVPIRARNTDVFVTYDAQKWTLSGGEWVRKSNLDANYAYPYTEITVLSSSHDIIYVEGPLLNDVFFSGPREPWMIQTPVLNQARELPLEILGTFSTVFPTGLALLAALLGISLIGSILRRTVFS